MTSKSGTVGTKRAQPGARASRPSRSKAVAAHPNADSLNEDLIVTEAMSIIADVGVAGLTMRRLSDNLGVALGATYHHVANRDALLALIVARVHEQVELPNPRSGDWLSRIRELLLNYVSTVSGYEGIAAYIMANQETAPRRIDETMHSYLDEAGFSRGGAEIVMSALFFYVGGTMVSGLMTTRVKGVSQRAMRARFTDGLDVLLKGVAVELVDDRRK
jgi:AcrR family transcriptional regulator